MFFSVGDEVDRDKIIEKLIDMLYERNNIDLKRGTFRVRGDVLEIIPIGQHSKGVRIEFFGDEIDRISEFDLVTGTIVSDKKTYTLFPASHFVTSEGKLKIAIERIKKELEDSSTNFKERINFRVSEIKREN